MSYNVCSNNVQRSAHVCTLICIINPLHHPKCQLRCEKKHPLLVDFRWCDERIKETLHLWSTIFSIFFFILSCQDDAMAAGHLKVFQVIHPGQTNSPAKKETTWFGHPKMAPKWGTQAQQVCSDVFLVGGSWLFHWMHSGSSRLFSPKQLCPSPEKKLPFQNHSKIIVIRVASFFQEKKTYGVRFAKVIECVCVCASQC